MSIHTKMLNGNGNVAVTTHALFEYAKTILGQNWTLDSSDSGNVNTLFFTDPTGSVNHGWKCDSHVTSEDYVDLISNGVSTGVDHTSTSVTAKFNEFTGFVWQGDGGSVGIGYRSEDGVYITWYLLIKLNGQYEGKDVYAVSCNRTKNVSGSIMIHGNSDIRTPNHCVREEIGSGVYLHPFYDPVSGLASSDVFGVQSIDIFGHATNGNIVKQGGVSYLSALSGVRDDPNVNNCLFIKM